MHKEKLEDYLANLKASEEKQACFKMNNNKGAKNGGIFSWTH